MTMLQRNQFDEMGTSAKGAMPSNGAIVGACLLSLLAVPTSAAIPSQNIKHYLLAVEQTNSGIDAAPEPSTSSAIMELRRLSGLTTDQLARIFKISRRSLHFWASGGNLNSSNEESLNRLLATVRKIDRGYAKANREILFTPTQEGKIPFDLLVEHRYEEVIQLLGAGVPRSHYRPLSISASAKLTREPQKPEELVGALQDSVHRDIGIGRAVKSLKKNK